MGSAIRVLIVDDSRLFREALAIFVEEVVGAEVVGCARDGLEALEMVARTQPEVVFMDLQMPRLDGLAATRALKAEPAPPAVVVCSSQDDQRLRLAALEAGADAFVHKGDLADAAAVLVRSLAYRRARCGGTS